MSAKNRKKPNIPRDQYPTPHAHIEQLVGHMVASGDLTSETSVLEPCAGEGRILDVLGVYGVRDTAGIEIDPKYQHPKVQTCDFLEVFETLPKYDYIITNPPYSKSAEFTEACLHVANRVVFLHRVNWLGSQARNVLDGFWSGIDYYRLALCSTRPSFVGGTDSCEYAWFFMRRATEPIQPGQARAVEIVHLPPIPRKRGTRR